MKYFVYILESLRDKKLYIGQTSDLEDRIKRHNEGRVPATSSRRPLKIVYYEEFKDRRSAIKRERYLKNLKSSKYVLEKIVAPSSRG